MVESDPVLDIIAERVRSGSEPGKRTDGFKVGKVGQGGGTRGVRLGGMLVASQALGLKNAFDAFYGDSAGPTSMAYFLSDQTPIGTSIYYDFLPKNFLDYKRPLRGEPLIDIPWMAYEVMGKMVPLNEQVIKDSLAPLHFYITSVDHGEIKCIDISKFSKRGDVLDAIHWTCRIPIVAGWPIEVSPNIFYTDGGVFTGTLALQQAIDDGCTHILAYLTRSIESARKVTLIDRISAKIMNHKHPKLGDTYIEGFQKYAAALDKINTRPTSAPFISSVFFNNSDIHISRTELRRNFLIQGAMDGFDKVMQTFSPYNLKVDSRIQVLI